RPRARAPPRIDADGVTLLVHARTCAVRACDAAAAIGTDTANHSARALGVRGVNRSEGTTRENGHTAATLTRCAGRETGGLEGRNHRLDVQPLHDRDLGAGDDGPVVTARLRCAVHRE